MKKWMLPLVVVVMGCAGCKNQPPPADTAPATATAKKNYFPVADYLRGQIREVDSLPVAILKVVTQDGKTDSSYIHRDEFDRLASEFIVPEIERSNFENNFTESAFVDQTTESATFNYSATGSRTGLERVDVLATPDELDSKVKSVYLESSVSHHDTLVVKKIFWQANQHFQILTIRRTPDQKQTMQQIRVSWS